MKIPSTENPKQCVYVAGGIIDYLRSVAGVEFKYKDEVSGAQGSFASILITKGFVLNYIDVVVRTNGHVTLTVKEEPRNVEEFKGKFRQLSSNDFYRAEYIAEDHTDTLGVIISELKLLK